jgi:hypothetical protein
MYELLHFAQPFQSRMKMDSPKILVKDEVYLHYGSDHGVLLHFIQSMMLRIGERRPTAQQVFLLLHDTSSTLDYRRMVEHTFLSRLWDVYNIPSPADSTRTVCKRVQFNIEKMPPCCENSGYGHKFRLI